MSWFGSHLRSPVYVIVAGLLLFTSSGAFNHLVAQVEEQQPPATGNEAPPADMNIEVPADDTEGENEIAVADAPKTFGSEIFKWPETTAEWVGVFFYFVLLIFSMVAAMIAIERLFNLRLENVVPSAFANRLRDLVSRGQDTPTNLRALAESGDTPVARVLKVALRRAGRPWPEVEKGMDDEMAWEMAALRGRHRALSVVGSVAPLVGLLGTVIGMIFAFMVTSQDAAVGSQAAQLGKGIYLALLTTAAGLTIAIPCLLLAARFNTQVDRYMRVMNETLLATMDCFVRLERGDRAVASEDSRSGESHNEDTTEEPEARVPVSAK